VPLFSRARSPYHNPIHAADALMSVHHFLCEFNFIDRLSREELLSVLVATIVHDFRHPCVACAARLEAHLSALARAAAPVPGPTRRIALKAAEVHVVAMRWTYDDAFVRRGSAAGLPTHTR
jgi:hypothetical protein